MSTGAYRRSGVEGAADGYSEAEREVLVVLVSGRGLAMAGLWVFEGNQQHPAWPCSEDPAAALCFRT